MNRWRPSEMTTPHFLIDAFALFAGTLVTEDLTCLMGGVWAGEGRMPLTWALFSCGLGIWVGDMLLVTLGRCVGRSLVTRWPFRRWVDDQALHRAEKWFEKKGPLLLLTSRFIPGARLPVYVAAGVLRMKFRVASLWFALAVALWVPILVGVAYFTGPSVLTWGRQLPLPFWLFSLLLTAAALCVLTLGHSLMSHRGRRLLVSRWVRLTHWEYWPTWAVYPPVVVYILWEALRQRSLTWFTAVNPGMGAGGGLVGESKAQILSHLLPSGAVAPFAAVRPGELKIRVAHCQGVMRDGGWSYPVVLKPDCGERGAGVLIVRDEDSLAPALEKSPGPMVLQKFVPGREYGLFYIQAPSENRGRLFAITDKRETRVTGDGKKKIEQLILDDRRAVGMAPYFLKTWVHRLDEVPDLGRSLALNELGTHSRGCLFLDGGHLASDALTREVHRVSSFHPGFFFGRYDVKARDERALVDGHFEVLELNGLTSEATSMYDPRHGLVHAWKTLLVQWAWAARLARENIRLGAKPLTVNQTCALLRTAYKKPAG